MRPQGEVSPGDEVLRLGGSDLGSSKRIGFKCSKGPKGLSLLLIIREPTISTSPFWFSYALHLPKGRFAIPFGWGVTASLVLI